LMNVVFMILNFLMINVIFTCKKKSSRFCTQAG
jgi:hypothetical protein